MSNSKELEISRWKAFRAKKKLAFGLILFHFSAVTFWLITTNFIAERALRIEIVSFWGLSIAGITYTLVIAAPLMVTKKLPETK